MKMIKEEDLPDPNDLPIIFMDSTKKLIEAGYEWVGIDHFAKKNAQSNKINFFEGKFNTPHIEGCVANLECKLVDKIKKGDHIIFVCEVINVINNDKLKPLSYCLSLLW